MRASRLVVAAAAATLGGCASLLGFEQLSEGFAADAANATTTDAGPADAEPPRPDASSQSDARHDHPCPPPRSDGGTCPAGAVTWRGRCYFLLTDGGSVDHATGRARCEALGAYLATFTCDDEWLAASALVFDITLLDARRASGTTPYAWTTGEPWSFESWNDGEPATSSNACLWSEKSQRWVAAPCHATAFPLCEIGAVAR